MSILAAVPTSLPRTGRSLIDRALFDRMATRIGREHPELAADMAERIVDQALAFLAACATTTRPIGPSRLVDIGWHTFVLYTRPYAEFCEGIAGRFIHHEPDDERPDVPGRAAAKPVPVQRAVDALTAAGYAVDHALWADGANCSKCTQCHAGCHDSPGRIVE